MTFQWPHAFWLLLLPAAFALAEVGRRVRTAVRRHPKILRAEASRAGLQLLPATATAGPAVRVRWRLWLGLACVVCAFARPQWGEVEEPVFEQSREILIAIDLSRSMLAPDVAPSRLERSKLLTTSLLDRLAGERVGLIVFAGTAFLQSPLSADYEILEEFLPALNPDYLPAGGTDYGALLDTALEAFSEDSGADRYLIILSDGESQTEAWQNRVREVQERDIHVITLGVGTAAGSMLPDGAGGFVKDERGAVVLSRLNPSTLEDLARRTGGVYRDASAWVDLADLLQQTVETGRQGEFAEQRRARRIERFQWALVPALVFLLWSVWREFPVEPRQRAVTIKSAARTGRTAAAWLACALLALPLPEARAVERVDASGNTIEDPNHILEPLPDSFDVTGEEAPPPPEAPVREIVGRLAGQAAVSATDYAALANETLTYGHRQKSTGQPLQKSAVHDALAGVDAGEALDATVADWPALRKQLQQLLEDDPQQQQQNQDQSQDQQDQENQQQQQQQKGGGQNEQKDGEQGDQQRDQSQSDSGQGGDQGEQQKEQSSSPSEQEGQEGEGEPQQNRDQTGENSESDGQHRPPEHRESAFGDLEEPKPPEEQPQSQPQPAPPRNPGTQRIGGQPTRSTEATDNPALALPLQKLDQLKEQDSPATLFQLMQDPAKPKPKNGRDW